MQNNSKVMKQLLEEVPISTSSEILDQNVRKRLAKDLIFTKIALRRVAYSLKKNSFTNLFKDFDCRFTWLLFRISLMVALCNL